MIHNTNFRGSEYAGLNFLLFELEYKFDNFFGRIKIIKPNIQLLAEQLSLKTLLHHFIQIFNSQVYRLFG